MTLFECITMCGIVILIFLLVIIDDKIEKYHNTIQEAIAKSEKTETSVTQDTEEYPYDLEEYAKEVSEREEHVQSLVDEIASYRSAHNFTASPPQVDSAGLYDYTPELFTDDVEIMTDSREVELEKRAKLW